MTPLELQYHNPLEAKVGQIITFEHEAELKGISFVIEQIAVYETRVGGKKFFHTDYCLKGVTAEMEKPLRLRLRLLKNEEAHNELGHTFQLLHLYDELGGIDAAAFLEYVAQNGDHNPDWDEAGEATFKINWDDEGKELEEPLRYWRVDEAIDPYSARQTILVDDDGNGKIDDDELDHRSVQYWDFSRIAITPEGASAVELIWVELDEKTQYVTLFRGSEILSDQVMVF